MADNEEGFDLPSNGTAVFTFAGITRVLKRPTLGQYRTLVEALGDMRDELLPDGEPEAGAEIKIKVSLQLDVLLAWYDKVFSTLAGEGLPRTSDGDIDEDGLPSWLFGNEVIPELLQHWQKVPSLRGGR